MGVNFESMFSGIAAIMKPKKKLDLKRQILWLFIQEKGKQREKSCSRRSMSSSA
jgi:hypothetical protein